MQPKRILALKRQTEGPWNEEVTILCSDADGSENLHPVIVSKFEKPYCLKG
jgi:hypothetical protein